MNYSSRKKYLPHQQFFFNENNQMYRRKRQEVAFSLGRLLCILR